MSNNELNMNNEADYELADMTLGASKLGRCALAVLVTALLLLLSGCSGDPDGSGNGGTQACKPNPPDCSLFPGPASISMGFGTKQTGYAIVADGAKKQVELGPQGLYMFQLAVRAQGMSAGEAGRVGCQDDPLVVVEIWHNSTQVGGSGAFYSGLSSTVDGLELSGIFTPFDSFDEIGQYIGQTVKLKSTVTDVCGNMGTDELDVEVLQ